MKFSPKLSQNLPKKKVRLLLFTPGPLTVSERVRRITAAGDVMHRSDAFGETLKEIQTNLLRAFELGENYFSCIFTATGRGANEAMIVSYVLHQNPLFITNGSWGDNLIRIARYYKKNINVLEFSKDRKIDPKKVKGFLETRGDIDTVVVVHQETRSGILNPLEEIAEIVKSGGCTLLVDAMSSAVVEEVNFEKLGVDMFTTSSAKGLRSFPGLGIVCGKIEEFEKLKPYPGGSHYFNLYAEYEVQRHKLQVRFAQSTILFYALREALRELLEEGIPKRRKTIQERTRLFRQWMKEKGGVFAVGETELGYAVTTFELPSGINYLQFREELRKYGIFLLYGDSIEGNQFQVSFLGAIKDREIRALKNALTNILFT